MSLAMFAAPFDDNINSSSISSTNNNIMNKKRQAHTKTQKKYPKENFDTEKVNSFLEKIHSNLGNDDDDDDTESFKQNDTTKPSENEKKENMMNMTSNNDLMFRTLGRAPQPNYEGTDNLDLNDYTNYGDNKTNEEYYKRVLPGYNNQPPRNNTNHINKSYYNTANYNPPLESSSSDILLQKLNYMITLLEDQQDERTNNVTEEVVLYSFLGIFIIFIADSFVRVGKYVR